MAIAGTNGPGPAQYNRVYVKKFGRPSARNVLVLVPGFIGGAGNFTLVARELVRRVDDLQVWAVDRRPNALEDTSRFAPGTSLEEARDYYLGLRLRMVDGSRDTPYARRWGLKVAVEDLRRVVLSARRGGRNVILGGHSLGASTTVAYATWDFNGRAGYRDVNGLVLIDGGLYGSFDVANLAGARRRKAQIDSGAPYEDILGLGFPWAGGVFAEIGAMFARRDPRAASPLQDYPLLPARFKPPVRVSNEALLLYNFDRDTVQPELRLLGVRAGRLAATGDPRQWDGGENTPPQNLASMLFQEPGNGVEWYFPRRLRLDVDGANPPTRNAVTRFLGLRTWHAARVNDQLFAYQTALTNGRVLRGARRFLRASRIPRAVYVNDVHAEHLDPLTASASRNSFLRTVVPFLERIKR